MKTRSIGVLNIIILVLLIILLNLVYANNQNTILETWQYDMFLNVDNYTGFNVETSAIFFGTVKPGAMSMRNIQFENNNVTLKVVIFTEGDLAKWVYTDKNSFILNPSEKKTVTIKALVPKNAEFGNYNGKIIVQFEQI